MAVTSPEQPFIVDQTTPPAKPRRTAWLLAFGALILGIAIGGGAVALALNPPSFGGDNGPTGSQQIINVCRSAVKDRLKAPATAQFSHEQASVPDGPSATATGTVDSQNGFGALIRNTFTCWMTKTNGTWEATNVSMSEG